MFQLTSASEPRPSPDHDTPGRLAARVLEGSEEIKPPTRPAADTNVLPLAIGFLTAYGVPRDALVTAARRAAALGASAADVLLAEDLVSEPHFYLSLAHFLGLRYVDEPIRLAPQTAFPHTILTGVATTAAHDPIYLAAPRGALLEMLIAAAEKSVRLPLAITTPTHLSRLVQAHTRDAIAWSASLGLPAAAPGSSARGGASTTQIALFAVLSAAATLLFAAVPQTGLAIVSVLLSPAFFAVILARSIATAAAIGAATPARHRMDDADLPVYSIVVALTREAAVAGKLIAQLERIDYPRAKLEIKIVIEEDDFETATVLADRCPAALYDIIVAPAGTPRTKPRALNVALPLLRGEFTVVFDAEDCPDPLQIRLAAERFAKAPDNVVCLQAMLVIDNDQDGWLQRLFALEYAGLFNVLNAGFAELRWPFPLGGSSNHFRTAALRAVGGWDAWNVTEDADLGLRLARFGCRAEVLHSATDEEAPPNLRAWFKQRRRWFKGWLQTAITLTRRPRRLASELGWARLIAVWAVMSGMVLAPLLWPIGAVWLAYAFFSFGWPQPDDLPDAAFATVWVFIAAAGLPAQLWPILLGMKRRNIDDLWPALLLLLPYQLLVTAAAWTAIYDLIVHPYHWFKTEHGLARSSRRRAWKRAD